MVTCERSGMSVPAGQSKEPAGRAGVAWLTGRLLAKGTRRLGGMEIAEMIESVGGEMATLSVGGWLEVRSEDLSLGLDLLGQCLFKPRFPVAELKKMRHEQLSGILVEQDSPQRVARMAFDEAIYRKHPFARPVLGYPETVKKLTRADCVAHHKAHFSPHQAILSLAGDFDPGALIEQLDRSWGSLPVGITPKIKVPRVSRQRRRREKRISNQKRQCHIYLGHLGVRRRHADFYRLQVMDHILGMGAGFTDRLSRVLRDELGLAYTVYASISAAAQEQPGTFHAYIGTSPTNEEAAVAGMRREIRRIRDEPVTSEELSGAKSYLTGSFVFKFETLRQLCGYMLRAERFGLGNYRTEYPSWINAVTAKDVQRVARTHLDPENLTLVVAGPAR